MNWDLSALYQGFGDPAFGRDMESLKQGTLEARAFLAGAGHWDEGATLGRLIEMMQALVALDLKLGNMLMLTLAADANDEAALAQYDRHRGLEVELKQLFSDAARYMEGVEDLDALAQADPLLRQHEYFLKKLKEQAAHTIDRALEPVVLKMQLSGGDAWSKLRDNLDAGHTVAYVLDDEAQTLTLSQVRNLAYSSDPAVRKAAFEAEMGGYAAIAQPMAACLNGIKGEALTLMPLKHYDSVLDQSIDQARITRPILDALIGAMEDALPTFRRYLKLKAKALGHEGGLPFYDLFARLGDGGETYTLDHAREMLADVLGGFSPAMGQMIHRAFAERWIDAYPRPGKQGGAFCSGVYALGHSFVLSNYDGYLGSVSTLAHELGHAYHDQQLFKNSVLMSDAPMTLAETASIFNETLLTGALIEKGGRQQKLMLLDMELTEATQTVVDILSRFYFERAVMERRADHALTPQELCDIMLDAQKRTYGDGLSVYHPYMWACKSHYYGTDLHFYNFPYAFGLLFGKGIYAQYLKEGPAFAQVYDRLLQNTALCDADQVAATVGIDLSDRAFWQSSLDLVKKSVDELEKNL